MLLHKLDEEKNPARYYVLGNEYIGLDHNYYLTDEQGSVRYVMDAAGNVQNDYRYDAFGQCIAGHENIPNRLRYNAQIEDDLTGLYYLRARYYNTGNGRFTQEDVIYNDGLNLYAYCSSNPVMYSDPSGFAKKPCKSKVGGECGSESGTNARYVDSQGNVYNNAKNYLNGPARMVNGDPLMYSMNNRNGGTVVLSTEPINGNSFINTLDYYNSQGKKVVILSGTHGSVTGESGLGANRLLLRKSKNAFCAERSFFNEDVNTANRYNNVKVYDITRMSDKKFKKLLNSKDVTICAWCYSERSNDIIKVVR